MSNNQSFSGSNSLYIDEMSTPIPDIVLLFDTLSMYSLGWKNNTIFNTIQSYDSILVHLTGAGETTPFNTIHYRNI